MHSTAGDYGAHSHLGPSKRNCQLIPSRRLPAKCTTILVFDPLISGPISLLLCSAHVVSHVRSLALLAMTNL